MTGDTDVSWGIYMYMYVCTRTLCTRIYVHVHVHVHVCTRFVSGNVSLKKCNSTVLMFNTIISLCVCVCMCVCVCSVHGREPLPTLDAHEVQDVRRELSQIRDKVNVILDSLDGRSAGGSVGAVRHSDSKRSLRALSPHPETPVTKTEGTHVHVHVHVCVHFFTAYNMCM